MEANERIAKPFHNLTELYDNVDKLTYWPAILELRKTADYVYRGTDVSAFVDKPQKLRKDGVPKTLVCHDLMGGYLEDKFLDGSNEEKSYHFYHWNVIDTFIYFSHHFVTIPPFGWINAAHRHGVKILGTVIVENTQGRLLCNEILNTRESVVKFANALVQIAQFYKFEGWLLNFENEVTDIEVPKLAFFVQYLTERIHERIEGSEIIWYDSVTNTGKLDWQNELNEKNELFFNSCDGIFLNYNWTDAGLMSSAMKVQKTGRVTDIYVGLDVWGRGCPGGGGFNSAYALQKIRQQGLSVAIFAPAWTFEFFGPSTYPRVENIFWAQLMQYLYIHVPIYTNERFITSFCRGAGAKYYEYGMQVTYRDPVTHKIVETNSSFYNMAMQRHQTAALCQHLKFTSMNIVPPIVRDEKSKPEPQECTYVTDHEIVKVLGSAITFEDRLNSYDGVNCLQFSYDVSYEGGGCLKLINKNVRSYHRLFFIDIDFPREIQARVIYKIDDSDLANTDSNNKLVLLLGGSNGLTSFLPRDTIQYGMGWKMSVFQTSMNAIHEIGVAMTKVGSCYIGKLIINEVRHPYRR